MTASVVHDGLPSSRTEKSALVPPMSNVMRCRRPGARAIDADAATPPAGPLRTMSIGRRTIARSVVTLPDERMTRNPSRRDASNAAR